MLFGSVSNIAAYSDNGVYMYSGHRLAKTVRTHDKYMRVMSNDMRCFKGGVVRGRACMFLLTTVRTHDKLSLDHFRVWEL